MIEPLPRDPARELREAAFNERQRLFGRLRRKAHSGFTPAEARRIRAEARQQPSSALPESKNDPAIEMEARQRRQAAFADRQKAIADNPHLANKHNAKLTPDDVRAIRLEYAEGNSTQRDLALKYHVTQTAVSWLLTGRTWAWLDAASWRPRESRCVSSLTAAEVREIRAEYAQGHCSYRDLARDYDKAELTIWKVVKRRTWAWLK